MAVTLAVAPQKKMQPTTTATKGSTAQFCWLYVIRIIDSLILILEHREKQMTVLYSGIHGSTEQFKSNFTSCVNLEEN